MPWKGGFALSCLSGQEERCPGKKVSLCPAFQGKRRGALERRVRFVLPFRARGEVLWKGGFALSCLSGQEERCSGKEGSLCPAFQGKRRGAVQRTGALEGVCRGRLSRSRGALRTQGYGGKIHGMFPGVFLRELFRALEGQGIVNLPLVLP